MTYDPFADTADSLIAPSQNVFTITPSDSAEVPEIPKAIYIGEPGDVTLRTVRGDADVTFKNVPAGAILDIRVLAVRATGTTASAILGLA